MRVFITGAAGQLGADLVVAGQLRGDEVMAVDRASLDITDRAAVAAAVGAARPDVVVNAAAYTAVDDCETNVAAAEDVNVDAVHHLRDACDAAAAHLVHVSTDYVFDGALDRPYRETDATNPMSVYGRTKLAGEVAAGPDATIVRTSWVCGEHGNNMVKLVMRLAHTDRPLAFVADQRGKPTFTTDLAPALLSLGADRQAGIFHVTNDGAVSWFEFVGDILEAAGHDRSRVTPITTAELDPPRPAPRPANSVLDNAAWADAGRRRLRHFGEPLGELIARLS